MINASCCHSSAAQCKEYDREGVTAVEVCCLLGCDAVKFRITLRYVADLLRRQPSVYTDIAQWGN
jgi:hypothetical protein